MFLKILESDKEPTLSDAIPSIKMLLGWLEKKKEKIQPEGETITLLDTSFVFEGNEYDNFYECEEIIEKSRTEIDIKYDEKKYNISNEKRELIDNIIKHINNQFIGDNNIITSKEAIMACF